MLRWFCIARIAILQIMTKMNSLKNHLLIAMPAMQDPNFHRGVVYICEHHKNGAMGILINKPLSNISLGDVLRHMDINFDNPLIEDYPVMMGGPIAREQGFIIHHNTQLEQATSVDPAGEVLISASKQDLNVLAHSQSLDDVIISLGYSGWEAGQLEEELVDNAWLVAPTDADVLFNTPFDQRWNAAAALIGVDLQNLSGDVGHA